MRLPLATTLRNRGSNTTRDARLLNAVVDARKRVQKRPSLVAQYDTANLGGGLGLFVRNTPKTPDGLGDTDNELIAITGSVITVNPILYVSQTHILTAANLGGTDFGFDGAGGSISPATYSGATIQSLFTTVSLAETQIQLSGVRLQTFFTSLTSNNVRLLSANATFSTGANSLWTWTGGSTIWTAIGDYPVAIV